MSRIFISYAHEDKEEALRLYDQLLDRGFAPWIDKRDLLPGERWRPTVRRAIRECSHFVALLSSRSVSKRGFVQAELAKALEMLSEVPKDVPFLIPVRLEKCEPTDERLAEIQWVDLFDDPEQAIESIVISLRKTPRSKEDFDKYLGKVDRTGCIVNQLSKLLEDRSIATICEQGAYSSFGIPPDLSRRPPEDIETGYGRLLLRQRELLCQLSEESWITIKLILQPFIPRRPEQIVAIRERLTALHAWMVDVAIEREHIDFVISKQRSFNRIIASDRVCVDGYRAKGAERLRGFPLSRSYYSKLRIEQALSEFHRIFSEAKVEYPTKESVVAKVEDLVRQCRG